MVPPDLKQLNWKYSFSQCTVVRRVSKMIFSFLRFQTLQTYLKGQISFCHQIEANNLPLLQLVQGCVCFFLKGGELSWIGWLTIYNYQTWTRTFFVRHRGSNFQVNTDWVWNEKNTLGKYAAWKRGGQVGNPPWEKKWTKVYQTTPLAQWTENVKYIHLELTKYRIYRAMTTHTAQ